MDLRPASNMSLHVYISCTLKNELWLAVSLGNIASRCRQPAS